MSSLQNAFLKKAAELKAATGNDPRDSVLELVSKKSAVYSSDNPQVHDLLNCKTLAQFREAAKKLLLRTPDVIDEVIQITRELFEKESFFKQFNAGLFQLESNLQETTNNGEREQLIKQALRRAGADPWKKKNQKNKK